MYPSLETVDRIRVLVGLNVDRFTVKIIDRYKDELRYQTVSANEGKTVLSDMVESEFDAATPSEEIEKGVRVFIDWLKSGKLEMRMYTEAPIHAKVYIMRKDPDKVPDTFGSVITGSSNFSESGLLNNLEFNVELKDSPDVHFALDRFEKLWAKGVDVMETYIDSVEKKTWIRNDITPYQIYLKTLYEFFREEINADKETFDTLLPDEYMRLQYQMDAVTQARQKLEAYNGVFISDVVGLGKTYICAMLANTLNRATYKLFICPPVLVDYWKGVLQEFDVGRFDVVSLGKLDSVIERGTDKYGYVFIDEAHRFRNSSTDSFTKLHEICWGKKVVLISATPINNYTSDIENQIYLFQPKQGGTINSIKNLEGFFRGLNSDLHKFTRGTPMYMAQLRKNSEVIRDKLLREVMIRRTRSEIVQYYADDMEKQGLSFPKLGNPIPIANVFKSAAVYPVVFRICDSGSKVPVSMNVMLDMTQIQTQNRIDVETFYADVNWDRYFTSKAGALEIIEKLTKFPQLHTLASVNGAATVSEAYLVKEFLIDEQYPLGESKKFINTGGIDPYKSFYGKEYIRYLKGKYMYPIVSCSDLERMSQKRLTESNMPKIIIGGMTKILECYYDKGEYLAGKSTTIVYNYDHLKYILAVLNSKLMTFYYQVFFNSMSLAGGFYRVGAPQVKTLPIAVPSDELVIKSVEEKVDELQTILESQCEEYDRATTLLSDIDSLIYQIYGLNESEVTVVEEHQS